MKRGAIRQYGYSIVGVGLSLLCSGCGGAGAGGVSNSAPGIPAAVAARTAAKGSARFVIHVPKKKRGHRPAYISPATQSMTIAIVQGTKAILNKTVELTPGSTGCSGTLASTVCTLTIGLAAGSYAVSIATFDGPNGTGNKLSTAQAVAFEIALGKDTPVYLTLSGIPASILVLSDGVNTVDVLAKDADGNFIIGNGAPAFTAALTSGSAVVAIAQPSASTPNEIGFSVATPPVTGRETIGITASYPSGQTDACAQTGAVCSLPSAVTASYGTQLLVANYGSGNVLGFSLPLTSNTQNPDSSVAAAGVFPISLDANDNLFAATYASQGNWYEYAPPFSPPAVADGDQGIDDPYGIAVDSSDDVFVASTGASTVVMYAPPYTAAPATISTQVSQPYAVTLDSTKNLYVANYGNKTVTVYASPYNAAPLSASTTGDPLSLTISGSNLFVGESNAVEVFSLPLSNGASPTAKLTTGIDNAYTMALDSSGDLFVANYQGNTNGTIAEFVPPFITGNLPHVTISESTSAGNVYNPWGIAFDSSGNLYAGNVSGGSVLGSGGVNEYSPPFSNASTPTHTLATSAMSDPYFVAVTKNAILQVSP